jgi:hypothetical protein
MKLRQSLLLAFALMAPWAVVLYPEPASAQNYANECAAANKTASDFAEVRFLAQYPNRTNCVTLPQFSGSTLVTKSCRVSVLGTSYWLDWTRSWTNPQQKSGTAVIQYEFEAYPDGNGTTGHTRNKFTSQCGGGGTPSLYYTTASTCVGGTSCNIGSTHDAGSF